MVKILEKSGKFVSPEMWEPWGVSLLGKVILINSLVGSLFIYKMNVLPSLPDTVIKGFYDIIVSFLWNGREPKIK